MKVVILGAGQVGRAVIKSLAPNQHMDLMVVDVDAAALDDVRNQYSVATLLGQGSSPDVLSIAGVEDCDALIAVTGSDEVNLVACRLALTLHETPIRIARIRNLAFLKREDLSLTLIDGFAVTNPISPELAVVDQLKNLMAFRGAIRVMQFVEGHVVITATRVTAASKVIGSNPASFLETSGRRGQIAAILRENQFITNLESAVIQEQDLLFVIGDIDDMAYISRDASGHKKPYKEIVIGGGGNIGLRLTEAALKLSPKPNVKVIEYDPMRARHIAEQLESSVNLTVLTGDASSESFLRANDINDSDLFCAVTNDDLVNVVSSQLAKRLKVGSVFTLVQRVDYVVPLSEGGIEVPVSPQQTTANLIHEIVSERTLTTFHRLPILGIDVVEITIKGDEEASKVAGLSYDQLQKKLPKGAHLLAIARAREPKASQLSYDVFSELHNTEIILAEGDRVIVFVNTSDAMARVEQLFRPKAISIF